MDKRVAWTGETFDALRAQNKRLTEQHANAEMAASDLWDENKRLRAENERLRAALEVGRFYVAIASERMDRNVYADLALINRAIDGDATSSPRDQPV